MPASAFGFALDRLRNPVRRATGRVMRNYARSLRHGMAAWRVLRARHDGVSGHGDLFGVVLRMPRHTSSTPCPCAQARYYAAGQPSHGSSRAPLGSLRRQPASIL
jgi:hypothetical protein